VNDTVEVRDARDDSQFELRVDGELAGIARYRRRDGRVEFVHTEIDDRFEGKGLGATLVKAALDATRTSGEQVVALCPFVASYIERHPDYADLLAPR
jgi:predicted GNAT family acetyltransferase